MRIGSFHLARLKRPKNWYWLDGTDQKMGIGQTEQTETRVLARPSRPKQGYGPDPTDWNKGIGQTEQTEIKVLARPNRPEYGYWPDRTDRKLPLARRKARPKFFPDHWGRSHRTPCPWPKSVWPIPGLGRGLHLGDRRNYCLIKLLSDGQTVRVFW